MQSPKRITGACQRPSDLLLRDRNLTYRKAAPYTSQPVVERNRRQARGHWA